MKTKSQIGKMSRRKGHNFERSIAIKLRHIYPKAIRQIEYQEGLGIDLANTGILDIQCKNKQQYASINTIDEIPRKDGRVRVLITKASRKDTMVVLELDDFITILNNVYSKHLHGETNGQELRL